MSSGLYNTHKADFDTKFDPTRVKAYGDTMNDGKVQFSFTLPVKNDERGIEAARQLVRKMGVDEPNVACAKTLDKEFTFFVVYGSVSHSVDYENIHVVTVEEESGEGRTFAAMGFNSFFSHRYASSQMIFDYGWDGFESFALDHVSGAAKGDCVVLGVDGGEVTKIAAKNKVGLLGDFSYKFTTKDKIYTYQINLVTAPLARYLADDTVDWKESGRLVGFVTKTWKEGKTKKTLYGIVDIVGLKPAE